MNEINLFVGDISAYNQTERVSVDDAFKLFRTVLQWSSKIKF
jgi:hypothetical protein